VIDALTALDHRVFLLINSGFGRVELDSVFEGLSSLGGWTLWLVVIALLAGVGRRKFFQHVAALAVVLGIVAGINNTVKREVRRHRPLNYFAEEIRTGTVEVRVIGERLHEKSFPSGHSMLAFFLMTYVAFYKRAYRYWALLLAFLIAFSRIYVGAHFPSDVIVGSLLGAAGGALAWLLFRFIEQRMDARHAAGGEAS